MGKERHPLSPTQRAGTRPPRKVHLHKHLTRDDDQTERMHRPPCARTTAPQPACSPAARACALRPSPENHGDLPPHAGILRKERKNMNRKGRRGVREPRCGKHPSARTSERESRRRRRTTLCGTKAAPRTAAGLRVRSLKSSCTSIAPARRVPPRDTRCDDHYQGRRNARPEGCQCAQA